MAKCTGIRCPMQFGYKVEECNRTDCPYRTEPMTNADRIRSMSDEELAEWALYKAHEILLGLIQWLKQPAEDPVRHGRWLKGGYVCGETEWICSVCGEKEWRTNCNRMKYCMFCGAKMDWEGEDNDKRNGDTE